MTIAFPIVIWVVLAVATLSIWLRWRESARADYIRSFMFPRGLLEKLQTKRPNLDTKELQLVARGLRQFFLAHLKSGQKFVAMPSQLADDLWHEFILYTRNYDVFCRRAFGQFLHHTPAVVLGRDKQDNAGLRRVWWYTCLEENINPRKATRLPLLFALDSKLGIDDGFRYSLDCSKQRDIGSGPIHCGGDMSSTSFDGSTDGFGGSSLLDGGVSDSGGDSSGCGGGCGGGGD